MATTLPRPDPLSATFSALADPTRRAILAQLVNGEVAVTQLAAPFRMSLPAVSKHLKVLERAGLVERSRHAQWRPCRLTPEPLRDVAVWVDRYRQLWEERFDRLDGYLREMQRTTPKDPSRANQLEPRVGTEEATDGDRK